MPPVIVVYTRWLNRGTTTLMQLISNLTLSITPFTTNEYGGHEVIRMVKSFQYSLLNNQISEDKHETPHNVGKDYQELKLISTTHPMSSGAIMMVKKDFGILSVSRVGYSSWPGKLESTLNFLKGIIFPAQQYQPWWVWWGWWGYLLLNNEPNPSPK